MIIKRISFQQILSVWKNHLWPDRHSAIETHSAMTWPFDHNPDPIDISIFGFPATFWGAFHNQVLVGVNSGHLTNTAQYRSRGLWVDTEHRGQGIAKQLLTQTEYQAIHEGARMIWSMPRIAALAAYTGVGYVTVGESFGTETSEANIYAVKRW